MHSISAIGDVRSQPYSRHNPQFNRETLMQGLARQNISYIFLGAELGARSSDRSCSGSGKVQFNCLWQTDRFKEGIKQVRTVMTHCRADVRKKTRSCAIGRCWLSLSAQRRHLIKHLLADGSIGNECRTGKAVETIEHPAGRPFHGP
jgi:uncharacterized protein (DUF488 family)